MTNSVYDAIKRATVAIVLEQPKAIPRRPFTIVGSGFCIHPEGIVVTCEHVFRPFVDPEGYRRIMQAASGENPETVELDALRPSAMFHSHVTGAEVHMIPVPIINAVTKTDFDLAVFKLHPHAAFAHKFPTLPIAKYEDVHEMMEIGTCGFPHDVLRAFPLHSYVARRKRV